MSKAITKNDVSRAAAELEAMRKSLRAWLRFRQINDGILAGTVRTKIPPGQAKKMIISARASSPIEQDLAHKLHALLAEVMPDALLPNADLRSNPNGAVQLAEIALTGQVPVMQSGPAAMGAVQPWLWPVLIVGGLLLAVTTAIRTAADVAKDAEEKECIRAGACTDYGFWLKAAAVLGIGWFAWKELGVGETVRSFVRKRRT